MKTYYKATRPDGTDFRTGTVDYAAALESGRPLKRLTALNGVYECCTSDVYHASDIPSETLIGGTWPCRLFEVTGRPVAASSRSKFGFRSLRVRREIPAWQALGPNGEGVAALIERVGRLTPEGISRLAVAGRSWDAAGSAAGNAAWAAAGRARDAAGIAAENAAENAARDAAGSAAGNAAWAAAGRARNAAWDAALALVVQDLISAEHFDILYGPWQAAVGTE